MRIKILAAAGVAIIIVATAAVIMSCRVDPAGPTPRTEMPSFDTPGIWGLVRDAESNDPIPEVYVEWWCETCDTWIGDDVADDLGRYDIDPPPPFNWSDHDGHILAGEATHPLYEPCAGNIPDFQSGIIPYRVDFEMVKGK